MSYPHINHDGYNAEGYSYSQGQPVNSYPQVSFPLLQPTSGQVAPILNIDIYNSRATMASKNTQIPIRRPRHTHTHLTTALHTD
jgi:hypothetical protein